MFARYSSIHHIVITCTVVLAGALSLRAADETVTGNLTVTGNTILQGVLDIGTAILPQGVTITGDSDLMGNIFTIGHGLNPDNITQNYGMAGLEIYIKNTTSTTRLIEQATTVDGTTFKWGTKAATDLNVNGILDDFGTQWMSLTGTTLTITGNLLGNGTDNQLSAQTLTGANSIVTRGLGDARYVQLTSTVPLTITNATAATSSTTGALIISGGIGVAKDSWINGVRLGRGLAGVSSNTALGAGTLNTNTTGSNNTASGLNSLYANTTGANNSATGVNALRYNTTGGANTATGVSALSANTTGSNNTGDGYQALKSNTIGGFNTVLGYNAANFHANGTTALTDPDGSVYIGAETRAKDNSDSNSVVIAGRTSTARGIGEGANTTVLGNSATTSTKIFGALSQAGGTVTTSKPHNFTQTWNAGAITFTGLQSNITDTASAAGSLLLDLQVGGVSKFSVDKAGNIAANNLTVAGQPVLTQSAAASNYLTTANATTTYLAKTTFDPDSDGKIDTAQMSGVAPLSITNSTASTSSTTGAVIVSGGLGVAKDAHINGVTIGAGGGNVAGNTAIGLNALKFTTTGAANTATGSYALYTNTTGQTNSAYGASALFSNSTGWQNTAVGAQTLYSNTTGGSNTATGNAALYLNTVGGQNTASGVSALYSNTAGSENTAHGFRALYSNTTGYSNVATGLDSLFSNTTGAANTAMGNYALISNTIGNHNIAMGQSALYQNITGSGNLAFGFGSGSFQADGITPLTTANNSLYLGSETRGFNNSDNNSIVIGYQAIGEGANTTVIGNSSTTSAHIYGQLNVSSLNVSGQPVLTQTAAAAAYLTPAQAATAYFNQTQSDIRYLRANDTFLTYGAGSSAVNDYSMALGQYSKAEGGGGLSSIALGTSAIAGLDVFEAGISSQVSEPYMWGGGNSAVAIGNGAYAGHNSVAIGGNAKARYGNVALGPNATAYGTSSFAFGYNSNSVGGNSIAMGTWAGSSGDNSISIGYATGAGAFGSMVLGYYSSASADHAMVIGKVLQALSPDSLVVGAHNIPDNYEGPSQRDPDDGIFVVGNGNGIPADPKEKSNAFVIKRNGDTEVKGDLKVEKNTTITGTTTLNGTATVKGQLIIEVPAGGIDMGEFGNP